MKKCIKQIKSQLLKTISEIDEYKWMFCRNPETDFTRNRKWSFEDAMLSILHMGCESTGRELLRYFDFRRKKDIPTVSSFVQRKNQILPEAFQFLFHQVTESVYRPKIYKGFRLLACDGSDINIPHNPNDRTTYFQSIPGTKGFNQMHLNALYDLFGGFYQDAVIQPARSENKYLAACKIILHLQKSNILFTNYNERKKKIMEYKKENGTLILGSVEEMRMFANGHITINHDNVKHLVYNGTPLPLGYRCALEFIMLDLNNLKDITIKNDQNFKSVNGIIYSQDGEKLIFCPNGTTGKIVIPDGVKTISKNAFMLCKISEVVIPNSVEIIGDSAFGQCEYLKQVFFSPDSKLKEIKSDAFFGCKMLSEITLPDNLSTMRDSVFRGSGLKHFTFPKYIEYIGNNIFESCAIKKINAPKELYVNHCYLDILKSCCTNQCDKVDTTNAFIFHMEEVKPIVIPKCVDSLKALYTVKEKIDAFLMQKEANVPELYKYGANNESREDAAVLQYQTYKSEHAYRSVLVKSSKIAKRKAETSESELMEFIMLDIWKPKALKTMLQIAEEKEYPIATAYILDKLPKKRGNKLNL